MERWTIRQNVSGHHDCRPQSNSRYPAGWATFDYSAAFDLAVEAVEVPLPVGCDLWTRERITSLRTGFERGLALMAERGRLVTSLRIEVTDIRRLPHDYEELGSQHAVMLLNQLLARHGVAGPVVEPGWLSSNVLALARGIRAEHAFDRMPILADALQDAGCDNADVLAHCRAPGAHVRGCWVVDLVLGKE